MQLFTLERIPWLRRVAPKWRRIVVGGTAIVVGIFAYAWFRPNATPVPDRVLCPINPSTVDNPQCRLYRGEDYPQHLYRLQEAVSLESNQLGLYKDYQGNVVAFSGVGFNPYPAQYSVIYPLDVLLYKTERETNNPAKCPEHLTRYGLCDTPIDGIVFGDGVDGVVDLAIAFQIESNPTNLEQLYDIGGLTRFIDLLKQVIRANRQLTDIEPQVANSTEGSQLIEASFRQAIEQWSLAHLISVESVGIRSITVGNKQYRDQLAQQQAQIAQQQVQIARSQQETRSIEQEKQALAARQELERQRQEFQRNQKLQDAQNTANSIGSICANVTRDRCPELIWVLLYGRQVPPFLNEEGELVGPPATPPAEQPQPSQ